MTYLLVDGNNLLARAAFAARTSRAQMSVDGVNTSALVIFINMLSKHVRTLKPTHMEVMWDHGYAHRTGILSTYKANRPPKVEEPHAVTPYQQAWEFLFWAGIYTRKFEGWEADDLIAEAVRAISGPKVILSSDKDLLQLIDPETVQYRPPSDDCWDVERVKASLGYSPEQIPLVMSLTGDMTDNVPGVAGIGPKKALGLLEKASWDWDEVLALLGPERAQQAILTRQLVDLRSTDYSALSSCRHIARFAPVSSRENLGWVRLMDFLDRWKLASVRQRVLDGTLWGGDEGPPRTAPEMFSGLLGDGA